MRDELLRLMHRQLDDLAVILLDRDGVVVEWMPGAKRIFGRDCDEMVGSTLEILFTPEDRADLVPVAELEHARRSGKSEDDRWMLRADGVRFWATGIMHRLDADDGSIVGFAKVLRDRTDLRAQVEALRNRVDVLEAEDKRKIVMFGTLAHEIRNPLGVLTNAAQLIQLTHPRDEKLTHAVQLMRRQIGYVGTLVDDLLEVVRARTGKTVLHLERLDLGSLIAAALESVGPQLRERGQHVEVLQPAVPVALDGDRVRLIQVLANLLTNACKFSERGARVWVKAIVEDDEIVIRVEDEGRGIDPTMLPHVFDLLTQVELGKGDRPAGLGLGLAIVKEYVELHGGTVQVRSDGIGRGSEFMVRLPLPHAARRADAVHASRSER